MTRKREVPAAFAWRAGRKAVATSSATWMFACINLARHADVDVRRRYAAINAKLERRFRRDRGGCSRRPDIARRRTLEELDRLWNCWRKPARRRRHGRFQAAEVAAMSAATSSTGLAYGLQRVCAAWRFCPFLVLRHEIPADRPPRAPTRKAPADRSRLDLGRVLCYMAIEVAKPGGKPLARARAHRKVWARLPGKSWHRVFRAASGCSG